MNCPMKWRTLYLSPFHNNSRLFSFFIRRILLEQSYLCFSLADTAVKNKGKNILINIKERLPCLFSDFSKYKIIVLRRRPYFTPVRANVTICLEKLTNEPSWFEGKISMLLWKAVTIENCAACHVHSQGLCYMWIHVKRPLNINACPLPDLTTFS